MLNNGYQIIANASCSLRKIAPLIPHKSINKQLTPKSIFNVHLLFINNSDAHNLLFVKEFKIFRK